MATATAKQVRYALHLMGEAGYETRYMTAKHSALGATMRERSGDVENWLAGMDCWQISKLIDRLKESDR